ncbi:molybdopterin-dependent oxidoreductase [Sneathiella sp. P13V-1]|nr:molybdopterin-dependent oxidoreductase [Sneathiella sp. P13V-1]
MRQKTKTTCPYCGVGCGIVISTSDGGVTVKGDAEHPANLGKLCSKGSALGETMGHEDRLLYPEISGKRAGWFDAIDSVANGLTETIQKHGPDSVAFYVSGQILTEDYYVANKLMKGFIGSGNIDTNSRLCMSSSVAAHKRAFGSDTVPGTYEDLETTDLLILTGSNLAWCHPVLFQRIIHAKKARPEMKVVVIDPRRTMTTDIADLHLPLHPDSDVVLFTGLLRQIDQANTVDQEYVDKFTNGFDTALSEAQSATIEVVSRITGLSRQDLQQFYDLFIATEKTVTVYSQGVNQSVMGTDKANAIINCHLATGRIGLEGMGPFSITGQPNAMGGREVGGLANMLAAHMDVGNEVHHEIVSRFWKTDKLTQKQGLKAVDMYKAVADGSIKAIWIMATNPVDSLPEADMIKEALSKCPMVVVSDIMGNTDTMAFADIKLPAAGWGEKDGTVTNSERRISRQKAFLPLPGEAKPDWWIISKVAQKMGFVKEFAYTSPADIFREHAELSAFENSGRRDFDIGAYHDISDEMYEDLAPFQWPQAKGEQPSTTRFFADGGFYTNDRKANFIPLSPGVPSSPCSNTLIMNTGRLRDQWHTMTRTGKSARLSAHAAEPIVDITFEDALKRNIHDGDIVKVSSAHGEIICKAKVSQELRAGEVFVPMHWTDEFANQARVNSLIRAVTDPVSGQPASKFTRVTISPLNPTIYGYAISFSKPIFIQADYRTTVRVENGWRTDFALSLQVDNPEKYASDLFSLNGDEDKLVYQDGRQQDNRIFIFKANKLIAALFLSPAPLNLSKDWLGQQLGSEIEDPVTRYKLAAGRPGADQPDKGPIICACFSVGAYEISDAVRSGKCSTVEQIGDVLKAGTNCGSCKSEIQQIIAPNQILAAE